LLRDAQELRRPIAQALRARRRNPAIAGLARIVMSGREVRIAQPLFATALLAVLTLLAFELRWSRTPAPASVAIPTVAAATVDVPTARPTALPPTIATAPVPVTGAAVPSPAPSPAAARGGDHATWRAEADRILSDAERLLAGRGYATVRASGCQAGRCSLELVYPDAAAHERALEALREDDVLGRWTGSLVESAVEPDGRGGLTQSLSLLPREDS
jgi:hypothetical protein